MIYFLYVHAEELTPMVAELESTKNAKESALSAKAETERKSREVINEQCMLIERLNAEKVCYYRWVHIFSWILGGTCRIENQLKGRNCKDRWHH